MCTSWVIQSAAASFEDGASARLATSANSTRSTTGSRRRAGQQPAQQRCRCPAAATAASSSHAPPSGRDSMNASPGARPAGPGPARPRPGRAAGSATRPAARSRPVELIGPAEAVQHLRPGGLRRRVPLVVDQLQVGHLRPVLVPPGRRPHEHVTRPYTTTAAHSTSRGRFVLPGVSGRGTRSHPADLHQPPRSCTRSPVSCGTQVASNSEHLRRPADIRESCRRAGRVVRSCEISVGARWGSGREGAACLRARCGR